MSTKVHADSPLGTAGPDLRARALSDGQQESGAVLPGFPVL